MKSPEIDLQAKISSHLIAVLNMFYGHKIMQLNRPVTFYQQEDRLSFGRRHTGFITPEELSLIKPSCYLQGMIHLTNTPLVYAASRKDNSFTQHQAKMITEIIKADYPAASAELESLLGNSKKHFTIESQHSPLTTMRRLHRDISHALQSDVAAKRTTYTVFHPDRSPTLDNLEIRQAPWNLKDGRDAIFRLDLTWSKETKKQQEHINRQLFSLWKMTFSGMKVGKISKDVIYHFNFDVNA